MFKFFLKLFGKAKHVTPKAPKEELYFIETALLGAKKETQAGLIESVKINENGSFRKLKFTGEATIESKHKGISLVVQSVNLDFVAPFLYKDTFTEGKKAKISFSLIHKTPKGEYELFGENKGMQVTEITDTHLKLRGEEDDAFYKLTKDCAKACIEQ